MNEADDAPIARAQDETKIDTSGAVTSADAATDAAESRRVRSVLSAVLGTIAVVGVMSGVLGFWTMRTVTDSDRFEHRAEELLRTEEVSNALARRVVADVAAAVDIAAAIDEVVPDVLEPAIDVLLAGVRTRVEVRVGELIRTDRVVETVGAAARRAHATTVAVLEGDDVVDGVAIDDGEVRINLLPLTTRTIGALQEIGLFGDVDVPELDRGGDPDEQRAELETALGRDLPDDFGEPVVFRSDSLDELGTTVQMVRDLLLLARRAFWLLILAGTAFAAASIWLARDRWRTAAFLVAGTFAGALLVRLAGGVAGDRVPDALEDPGAQVTVAQIVDALETSLSRTLLGFSVLALVGLLLATWAIHGHPEWMRRRARDTA